MQPKSSKISSSLCPTILHPNGQEWRPIPQFQEFLFQHHHYLPPVPFCYGPVAVVPPPPPAVLTPPQPLYFPSFDQSFIPYAPYPMPYSLYDQSSFISNPPPSGSFQEAAPPCSGGGGGETKAEAKSLEMRQTEKGESSMVKSPECYRAGVRRRSVPPRLRRAMWFSSNFQQKLSTTLRQEWRPKKDQNPDNRIARVSSAAHAPPCASPKPKSVSRPPPKTTIMIKNIPNQYRRDDMLKFLDGYCDLHVAYDFFYLLMDFRTEDNLGYAFVNFTTSRAALKIKRSLQNYEWGTVHTRRGSFRSNKICEITWANFQGKERLIKRFLNTKFACDKLEFLPVVFDPPRNGSKSKSDPIIVGQLKK